MTNVAKQILLAIFLSLTILPAFCAGNVADADSAYSRGEYTRAIELYKDIIAKDGTSPQILYNLGNAYSKAGDYGNAVLSYKRSLRIDPSFSPAKNNLEYVAGRVADNNRAEIKGKKLNADPESSSFFSSVKNFITSDHTSNSWAVWSAVTFVLFASCAALYIFTKRVLLRKIGFFAGLSLLGVSLIFLLFSFYAASSSAKHDTGVITGYKVTLKSDASASSKDVAAPLTRGTVMSVLESFPADSEKPQWYKVRLNSDYVGWINSGDFTII